MECQILGKRMKSYMNPKISPCDDFYESVCGNYPKDGSGEQDEDEDDDIADLAKLIVTYQPISKSEKIAMKVLEKCMDKSRNRNQIDRSFWDNLQNHSLTDVLIEAVKVNPLYTGFLENDVYMEQNSSTNSKYLRLSITAGLAENSKMEEVFEQIKSENEDLEKRIYISLDEAKNQIKFIDLEKYVSSLLPEEYRKIENDGEWKVDINAMIILERVVNITGVEHVKEVIRYEYLSTLDKYLVKPNFPRCFKRLMKLFPGTLANIFVKNFVGDKNLDKANQLFKDLQKVFIEMLNENDWLGQHLKNLLKQEVLDMKASIGIPDEYKDQKNVDRMYSRIADDFENQSYLTLIQSLLRMNSEETFLRVSRKEEITYLGKTIGTNANYLPENHRTSISPIFLNFPYIDKNLPEWNTYATIGLILGHEIGHAFDAMDFFKNPMGEKIKMSSKMKKIFRQRIKCIIEKYNKYQFPDGTFSDGSLTQQEDSADMIGFDLVYRLFKKLENPQKFSSFEEYTAEQQYFQRIGILWCSGETNEKQLERIKDDVHSFHKFRINGMMSNSEEFAKAFNCPKNSPMNPEKKCPLFK
ncbi:unnamed protein product [Caenorhabditis angaria]|uniref:Peptidase M13 C-terminal domain-containing protein n=1 Tax=Caenorhabditis angaria TaxID=860376 RepID=A0A9P1MXW1_9PELO|nr:unnamed protein product [Caenorhabditis angaria]